MFVKLSEKQHKRLLAILGTVTCQGEEAAREYIQILDAIRNPILEQNQQEQKEN